MSKNSCDRQGQKGDQIKDKYQFLKSQIRCDLMATMWAERQATPECVAFLKSMNDMDTALPCPGPAA